MKLLVDTDVFCKLGRVDLLHPAADLLVAGLHECGRLPALPHMLRRGSLRKMYGPAASDAMIAVAEPLPVVPEAGEAWLDRLTPIDAIDPGEAQLYAAAAETGLMVMSGDKRALRALRELPEYVHAIGGRVVVFEAILLALCEHLGPEEVRSRVQPLAVTDKVIAICFSPETADPTEPLRSYYGSLAAELEPLVLWKPGPGGED